MTDFDEKVREIKRKARFDFSVFSFVENSTPNFTNHLEVIEHKGQKYLVKAKKFYSNLFFNTKSLLTHTGFRWKGRQEYEAQTLERLTILGANVPTHYETDVDDVLVMRYYEGQETKKVLREEGYEKTLSSLAQGLGIIHQVGTHGEPSTNNTFVYNEGYWADFERFKPEASEQDKARELARFIKSVTKHSYRPLQEIMDIVYESYPRPQVKILAIELLTL